MLIQKYCSERLKTRYITARTIVRERKLKRLAQKAYGEKTTKYKK